MRVGGSHGSMRYLARSRTAEGDFTPPNAVQAHLSAYRLHRMRNGPLLANGSSIWSFLGI